MPQSHPGLIIETLPSGNIRIRVRVKGQRMRKIVITTLPGERGFEEEYTLARKGKTNNSPEAIVDRSGPIWTTLCRCIQRAKRRCVGKPYECTIDAAFLRQMLTDQNYKCALSGRVFDLRSGIYKRRPWAMSVDRIEVERGYEPDNVRLTTVAVNTARSDWSDEDFIKMCADVVRKSGPQKILNSDMVHIEK